MQGNYNRWMKFWEYLGFPTETNDLNGHLTSAATTINSWLWLY